MEIIGRSTASLQAKPEEINAETSALQLERIVTEASNPQEIVTEVFDPQVEEIIAEDGILCLILSLLPLREAVRTSVLSSRWRHLWTHVTKFNLNAITVLNAHTLQGCHLDTKQAYDVTKGKTNKFIRTVDSIVQQLQGARIYEFAVRYFLDKSHSHHIDAWVRFAVASEPKLLCLHMFKPYWDSSIEPYDFPCHLLKSSRSIEKFSLMFCSLKLPSDFHAFGHLKLKVLVLLQVDVSQEDFNCILSKCCSTLEIICVCAAPRLVSISSPHPLSELHTLTIRNCDLLTKVEINAVNLLKLDCMGFPVDFKFRQSSKLNDAYICFKAGGTERNLEYYLTKLSSNLDHLQYLNLRISGISQMTDLPKDSCRFIHLRHLGWKWDATIKMSHLDLATLLDAAPFLEELKLCLSRRGLEPPPQTLGKFREMLPKRPHTHLKKIHVGGFYFEMWQIEIAVYLLNNATELESMTIEKSGTPSEEIHERGMKIFNQEVQAKVKFVII